ncbi:hypothetical protein MVES1_003978 [Malassezia vespertilionis]|uniref:uncharacterized protein n=1 Tax=Malassezia vespertilionis TaxID=2020962 RepID=UPI0024B0BD64|nr:uncharacterized protein MVES1_003978 [Malassezia vespertilionis]WFD08602.1 hypothetical protein MVES1_003978 [Malassezia vespertilionis]
MHEPILQTKSTPQDVRYWNTLDAFVKIYQREGLGAFYRGLFASLLGITHVAVQFPLYEWFKELAHKYEQRDTLGPGTILICSGGSKMVASIATYPHEVIRTRLQMISNSTHRQYTSFLQTVRYIYKHEGIRGFYRGMGVNLVRTVPNSGLTILTYEVILHYFATHASST